MIEINWKNARTETPKFERKTGRKYDSIEIVWCLVSDGTEVWEESYDPTEGFDHSIVRFIEFKSIKP